MSFESVVGKNTKDNSGFTPLLPFLSCLKKKYVLYLTCMIFRIYFQCRRHVAWGPRKTVIGGKT